MTDSRTAACCAISDVRQNRRFGRRAFYARSMKRVGSVIVAAGKCYGPRCMAENTSPWPCWYLLARFCIHATKKGPQNQASLVLARHASREVAIAPIARSPLSTSFLFLPRVSHRPSFPLFFSGNPVLFWQFLPSRSDRLESLFVIICAIFLTVHIQIVWSNCRGIAIVDKRKDKVNLYYVTFIAFIT